MCGILGLHAPTVTRERLERANQQIRHRGPDDAGYYVGANIGFAARRLSIIDLPGGQQPLSNEEGTVWISYNGEIFNAPQLRQELLALGHRFRTQSDTEVIVHGYEEWGADVPQRLRGMFAFAIWDTNRRRLLLARDRLGIKPLYYAQDGAALAFASEITPLFTLLPNLPRHANHAALQQMFQQGFISTPLTAVANIYKLPPAHTLLLDDGEITIRPYWQLTYAQPDAYLSLSQEEAVEQFMQYLRDAVDAWRLSDVPIGSLLSGGVDSGTLATLLTELNGNPIHTFTIGFEAASHDETAVAQQTAQMIDSHQHTLTFTAANFDYLPHVIRHLEEPQCSATAIPIYLLYKACHEAGFKVILTGEGADELLGGYHWFDGDRRIRPFLNLPRWLRRPLAHLPLPVSAAGQRVLAQGSSDPLTRFALWQQVTPPQQLASLWQGRDETLLSATNMPQINGRHPLHQFLHLESISRLPNFINFEVDRMSMASSIEARPPFLDHHLWEFCAQLPPEYKLKAGINKYLLRKGMQGKLPPAVQNRPKQGLATPHALWWQQEKLPAWAEECLHPTALTETGYFNPQMVAHLRREHGNGRKNHSRILMGILTTQLWQQQMQISPT